MAGLVLVPGKDQQYFITPTSLFLEACYTGVWSFLSSRVGWQKMLKALAGLRTWGLGWKFTSEHEFSANVMDRLVKRA